MRHEEEAGQVMRGQGLSGFLGQSQDRAQRPQAPSMPQLPSPNTMGQGQSVGQQLPPQANAMAQQNAFGMNPMAGGGMPGQLPPQANAMAQQNAFGQNPMAQQPMQPPQVSPQAQQAAMAQEMQRRGREMPPMASPPVMPQQGMAPQRPDQMGQSAMQGFPQQAMNPQPGLPQGNPQYDQIMQILQSIYGRR